MSVLFCITNLLEVGRKKHIFNSMDFNPFQTKIKYNVPIINVKGMLQRIFEHFLKKPMQEKLDISKTK